MATITILLADDHGIVRAGLRSLLSSHTDLEVVAEAQDGTEAIALAQEKQPDVAVLDVEMPGVTGIEATERIRETCPNTKVLILTMHDDQALVRAAVAAGAGGYLVKDGVGAELVTAIRAVHQGRSYLNVSLAGGELQEVLHKERGGKTGSGSELLSPREREVLELLAHGFTNQEIANQLHLSTKTVGTHRGRISEKLGLRTRADIVRYALESGLLTPSTGK